MKIRDLLGLALVGLKRRRTRTLLTVSGVVIGTVCIVLMFAMGLTNYQQFQDNWYNDQSLTLINLYTSGEGNQGSAQITEQVLASIQGMKHVEQVSPVITFPVTVTAGKYKADLYVTAMDSKMMDLSFSQGSMFTGTSFMPDIILGYNQMQMFIDPDNPPSYTASGEGEEVYSPEIDWLQDKMNLSLGSDYGGDSDMPPSKSYKMSVQGVTKASYDQNSYNTYMQLDSAKRLLLENRKTADYLNINQNGYSQAIIKVDSLDGVESVLKEVGSLGYQVYSPVESIKQMQQEQARQQSQLFAIGFITLFVSAIGIANTMYANILERKKEIGVMKVVGMPMVHIRMVFLLEAAGLGLVGGLVGIGISYLLAMILGSGTGETVFLGMYFASGMSIVIPWWLSIGALAIAMVVGIVSGIYPAYKASQLSPMEAMRGE